MAVYGIDEVSDLDLPADVVVKANWSTAVTRYYAIDPDSGVDTNVGFSDVDMATAFTVPIKTWAQFLSIVPLVGAGRRMVVGIKPRAAGATIAEDLVWRGITGYRYAAIEAVTTGANDTADQVQAGGLQAIVGPNGDGSWTVAAAPAPTTSTFSVSAGTLTAETVLLKKRIRFKGNVTAGLTNIATEIHANTSTAITAGENLTATPATGDEFFIEQPGVVFPNVVVALDGASTLRIPDSTSALPSFGIKGIACATGGTFYVTGPARRLTLAFCETRGTASLILDTIATIDGRTNFWRNESGTTIRVGVTCRVEGSFNAFGSDLFQALNWGFVSATSKPIFQNLEGFLIGPGCVFAIGAVIQRCGLTSPLGSDSVSGINESAVFGRTAGFSTTRDARIIGTNATPGLQVVQSRLSIVGPDFTGMGANPAIRIFGTGCQVRLDGITGSTGNTDVGVDLSSCRASAIVAGINTANTATGTTGDIRNGVSTVVTWASLASAVSMDTSGNLLFGTGGVNVVTGTGVPTIDGSAAAFVTGSIAPVQIDIGDAQTTGTANTAARADHQHALPVPAAPADVTKAAASAGSATTTARADHKHDISTAAAGASIDIDDAAAEGTATSLARSDHQHAFSGGSAPPDIAAAAAVGTATTPARSDHTHTIGAGIVTSAMLRNSAALTVIGRSANSTGVPADIAATAASGAVLRESGSTVGFGTVATAGLAANAATDAILRQGAALTVIGRSANSTGNVADIAGANIGNVLMVDAGPTLAFKAAYNSIQTYTPSAAGTATLDLSKGNIHHITMPAGNITIALSNATTGQCFIVRILQDGTGSRTVTWFTTIKWAGGTAPTLTVTASKADTLGFEITGTNTYDGVVVGANI